MGFSLALRIVALAIVQSWAWQIGGGIRKPANGQPPMASTFPSLHITRDRWIAISVLSVAVGVARLAWSFSPGFPTMIGDAG